MALAYGPGGPDGPNGQDGGAAVYPDGLLCRSLAWLGLQIYRRVCGQLDGCGGMRVAVARRLPMDPMDQMDQMDKIGAPLNNPWVCGAAVWNGSGAD